MRRNWDHIAGIRASSYFFQEVVGTATLDEDLQPSTLIFANVFCSLLVWAIIGSSLAYGVKGTGRVVYVTLGLPTLLLFVVFIRTLTLPGAFSGISKYLFGWDWSVFADQPDIWSTAVSQTFFSLGIAVRDLVGPIRNRIGCFLRNSFSFSLFPPLSLES